MHIVHIECVKSLSALQNFTKNAEVNVHCAVLKIQQYLSRRGAWALQHNFGGLRMTTLKPFPKVIHFRMLFVFIRIYTVQVCVFNTILVGLE